MFFSTVDGLYYELLVVQLSSNAYFIPIVCSLVYVTSNRFSRIYFPYLNIIHTTTHTIIRIDAHYHCRDTVTRAITADFTDDERLLAGTLIYNLAPFDLSLAWAFAKEVFDNNKLRFKCAWEFLVQKGWVHYSAELGYYLPFGSSLIGFGFKTNPKAEQLKWTKYINYWTREVVRINVMTRESLTSLFQFDSHRRHFSLLFALFFNNSIERNPLLSNKSMMKKQSKNIVDENYPYSSITNFRGGSGTLEEQQQKIILQQAVNNNFTNRLKSRLKRRIGGELACYYFEQ